MKALENGFQPLGILAVPGPQQPPIDQHFHERGIYVDAHGDGAALLALSVAALFLGSGKRAGRGHLPPPQYA